MSRWSFIAWSLLSALAGMAQPTFHVTLDSVQTTGGGSARSVREVDGGFLLFAQQISPDSSGETHLIVHKIDPSGAYLWAKDYGAGAEYGFGFTDPVSEPIGDSIYVGTQRFGFEYADLFFTVFDVNGDSIRSKVLFYDDSSHRWLRNIVPVGSTGFMLCGGFRPPGASAEGLLIRTDLAGDTLWTKRYAGIPEILSMDTYLDGGFLLAGYRYNPANTCIKRIDSLGNVLWTRWLGGDWPYSIIAVMKGSDGSAIACTNYRDPAYPTDFADQMVVKYDANGDLIWQKRFIPFYFSNTYDLLELNDGSIVIGGFHAPRTSITKVSSNGDSLWSRAYRYYDDDGSWQTPYDIEATSDGGFVLTGAIVQDTGDPNPGLHTIFALKVDSMGCLTPGCGEVGVEDMLVGLENALNVFPNPSDGQAEVTINLPEDIEIHGFLVLMITDAGGRKIESHELPALNAQRVCVDLNDRPAGTYALHLLEGSRLLTGKIIVLQ